MHDLPGDPDLENPDDDSEDYDDQYIEDSYHRNELLWNETPMYVRPYVEDPVWLQPDDDEMGLLHDIQVGKEAAAKGEKV